MLLPQVRVVPRARLRARLRIDPAGVERMYLWLCARQARTRLAPLREIWRVLDRTEQDSRGALPPTVSRAVRAWWAEVDPIADRLIAGQDRFGKPAKKW